jgi:hypothetical protein
MLVPQSTMSLLNKERNNMETIAPILGSLPSLKEMEERFGTSELSDKDLEKLSNETRWGSFGVSGKDPIKYTLMCNLETDHIENILMYCRTTPLIKKILLFILKKRCIKIGLDLAPRPWHNI